MNTTLQLDEFLDDSDLDSLDEMEAIYYSSLNDQLNEAGQQGGSSLTPPSVTTLPLSESYKIGIGWLTFSFFCSEPGLLLAAVGEVEATYYQYMMDSFLEPSYPINTYKSVRKTVAGSLFAYTEGRHDFCLIIPQTVCESFTIPYLLHLVKVMQTIGGRVTRIDLPIDDFTKTLNIDKIFETTTSGEMVSRLRKVKPEKEIDRITNQITNQCLRLGSRKKQFYVRIYNKELESKGKVKSIRLEAELKGAFARASVNYIYNKSFNLPFVGEAIEAFDQSAFNKAVLSVLLTRIDFREVDSDSNISRRRRSSWWAGFCEGVEKIKLTLPKVEAKIEKTLNWLAEGVSTSLAIAAKFFQGDFIDYLGGLLQYGEARLKPRHYALLPRLLPAAPAATT